MKLYEKMKRTSLCRLLNFAIYTRDFHPRLKTFGRNVHVRSFYSSNCQASSEYFYSLVVVDLELDLKMSIYIITTRKSSFDHLENIVDIYDGLVEENVLKNDYHQRSVINNLQELSEDIINYKPHNLGFLNKVTGLRNCISP